MHELIGRLALYLNPQARNVLVLGLRGGATTIAVGQSGVEVDVVELSDGMAKGAEWLNHRVLPGPNVHLHIGDGAELLDVVPQAL